MITRHDDPATFRALVEPLLSRREAENNLLLGILAAVKPYAGLLLLDVAGAGVALRTPPYNLVISDLPPPLLDALVARLSADDEALPGVMGPSAAATHFARAWSRARGLAARRHHAMRAFENRRVVEPPPPVDGGALRDARQDDLAQVLAWVERFGRDVGSATPTARALTEERVRAGAFVLWETERVVSMAAVARQTPRGAAVAYVYTPPELRGRGYASACVAGLTRRLQAAGRTAFLFTDLANPTSNRIYQAIGYVPVSDAEEWRFEAAVAAAPSNVEPSGR